MNNSHISGAQNIVIQGVSDSTITVSVNGETQEIRKDIAELKALLAKNQTTSFQSGEKIYNIGEINEANFGTIVHQHHYHFYGEKKIKRFLSAPPFNPPVFIGRDDELQTVHDKLFNGQNFLMLVNGQGGIGKTSFAAKYWERYQAEYSHLAFLYVENGISNALLTLANELAVQFPAEMPNDERLQVLVRHIANLQKPCLLILDNANSETDLNENILTLRQCANFHILLTSRLAKFEKAQKHPIGALSQENALAVFKEHYVLFEEAETTLFYQIFEAVGGNTLLLELFAKNLSNFNNQLRKRYTLQNLLADLQKGLTKLSQSREITTAYQAKGTGLRYESPEAIILAMYDLTELNETEKAILSVFAALPAENIAFTTLETFVEAENPDQDLLALAQKGWIEYNEASASFKCNPLVQEIARHKNQERLFADCKKLITTLIALFHPDTARQANYQVAILHSPYAESLLAILTETDYDLARLCERLGRFYQTLGNLNKALEFFEKDLEITKKLAALEPTNVSFAHDLAISYSKLGEVYTAQGNTPKALEYFEKYNEITKKLTALEPNNVSFAHNLAISYEKLGEVYTAQGNTPKALEYFEKDLEVTKKLAALEPNNVNFARGLAISYSKLGEVYIAQGNTPKALEFFEKYNEITKKLSALEPTNVDFAHGLAISYGKLAEVYSAQGNLEKVLELIGKTTEIFQKLYALEPNNVSFAHNLAISYEKLGEVYTAQGDTPKALKYFEKSNEITKKLSALEPTNVNFARGLAISYSKLGEVYTAQGDTPKALKFFEKDLEITKKLAALEPNNVDFANGLAISYQYLGNVYTAQGDTPKALEYFEKYNEIKKKLSALEPNNVSFANGLAISYYKLYEVYLKSDKRKEAKEYLTQAVKIFERLATQYPDYEQFTRGYNITKNKLKELE
jgi:tetratricopeptide (TPR) repeat protein